MTTEPAVFEMQTFLQAIATSEISAGLMSPVIAIHHTYACSASELRRNKLEQWTKMDAEGTNNNRLSS